VIKTNFGKNIDGWPVYAPISKQLVNHEQTKWNGRGNKPAALADAERHCDDADIELARVADKIKL
jgi:hypothetical protein